jgi:hypothetical protein
VPLHVGAVVPGHAGGAPGGAAGPDAAVGLYKLNPVDPWLDSARFQNIETIQ